MSFKISFYSGKQCTGASDGNIIVGPSRGCHTDGAGVAAAAVISSTGPVDDTPYTVFFSGDDCNPDTVIEKGDDGCVSANYKSFQVWNVCPDDKNDCL